MKLIFCPYCQDVVKLKKEKRYCDCNKIWGKYTDNLNAVISSMAIPIGFSNNSFMDAVKSMPNLDFGTKFDAFVISRKNETIKIQRDK